MLDAYEEIPFKSLLYFVGECNYGGRVTDDHDRKTLMALLKDFLNPEVLNDNYKFTDLEKYTFPKDSTLVVDYLQYIRQLPSYDSPLLFGLHQNADITFARNQGSRLLEDLIQIQPRGKGSDQEKQNLELQKMCQDILSKIREPFDLNFVNSKFQFDYKDSMNTVLLQELQRYNRLIECVRISLIEMDRALAGEVLITQEIELFLQKLTQQHYSKPMDAKGISKQKASCELGCRFKSSIKYV